MVEKEKEQKDTELIKKQKDTELIKEKETELILHKGQNFNLDDFEIIKELGHGAYAKVYLCFGKKDKKEYALKSFGKGSMIKENKLYQVYIEADLMLKLDNYYITKAYSGFEENKRLILVLDYYKNGDLFDFISVNSKFAF